MNKSASTPTVDLIVPVFNEADNLPAFFKRLSALNLDCQVIFVDNASTDGSLQMLQDYPGARVIAHATNEGYGASLIDGMRTGTGEHIVIIDADCEYPPECIPQLLAALQQHDVVYASRFLGRTSLGRSAARDANMPWLKLFGNRVISGAFNVLFGQSVTDLYTGCKALTRRSVENIHLQQTGFEHVLELAARQAARGYHIAEIAVDFQARQAGQSKMKHLSETAKYIYLLTRYAIQNAAGTLA